MTGAALAAERIVRAFASATNSFLAGASFVVLGEDERSGHVRQILRDLGAQLIAAGDGTASGGGARHDATDGDDGTPGHGSVLAGQPVTTIVVSGAAEPRAGTLTVDATPGAIQRALTDRPIRPGVGERDVPGGPAQVCAVDPDEVPATGAGAPERQSNPVGRMAWAAAHMPVTAALAAELADAGLLAHRRIVVSLVLEPKTSVLARALRDAGAEPILFANCVETDTAVAAELRAQGFAVHAPVSPVAESDQAAVDRAHALAALDAEPELLIDDGAQLIRLAHLERPRVLDGLIAAAEETTSGVRALELMGSALRIPVVAVNDARTKTLVDNRHGTGHSCVLAVADLCDRVAARDDGQRGSRWSVFGFGPVGEGTAEAARALGAVVTVVDTDPMRALAALNRGFAVAPALHAAATADVLISASGHHGTLNRAVVEASAPGTVLAIAGGVPEEITLSALSLAGYRRVPNADGTELLGAPDGTTRLLLAGGDGVNYAAGEGNPIEVMDLSFASQLEALRSIVADAGAGKAQRSEGAAAFGTRTPGRPVPGVSRLTREAENRVARLALLSRGVDIAQDGGTAGTEAAPDWRQHRYVPSSSSSDTTSSSTPPPFPTLEAE